MLNSFNVGVERYKTKTLMAASGLESNCNKFMNQLVQINQKSVLIVFIRGYQIEMHRYGSN